MILVTQAVVDERAVMVEKLYTSLANLAVEVCLSLNYFIIRTEVV